MKDYALLGLLLGMPVVAAGFLLRGWSIWFKNSHGATRAGRRIVSVLGLTTSSAGMLLSISLMAGRASRLFVYGEAMFPVFQLVLVLSYTSIVAGLFSDAKVRLCIMGSSLATIASWMVSF